MYEYFKCNNEQHDKDSFTQTLNRHASHKRSETITKMLPSHYNQKQILLDPLVDKQKSFINRPPALTQNNTLHNSSVQDSSYISIYRENTSSLGASPINKNSIQNNMAKNKQSYQLAYMTLKIKANEKTKPISTPVNQFSNPLKLQIQTFKHEKPITTPQVISSKFKKLHTKTPSLTGNTLSQIKISDTSKHSLNPPTPLFQQRHQHSNTISKLPQIPRHRSRLDTDLQEMFPKVQNHYQQMHTRNQSNQESISVSKLEETKIKVVKTQKHENVQAKKYMKMIERIIQKNPKGKNANEQQHQMRLTKARRFLFQGQQSRNSSEMGVHSQLNGNVSNVMDAQVYTQQCTSPDLLISNLKTETQYQSPTFKIENRDSHETQEVGDQYSPMNQISQNQKSGSVLANEIKRRKNSIHQSYQLNQQSQDDNTPVFQKKHDIVQMRSDGTANRFNGTQSLEKESTEVSSIPYYYNQNSQPNNNSNCQLPTFIQSSLNSNIQRTNSDNSGKTNNQEAIFIQVQQQPKVSIRESNQKNPLESSVKSSLHLKLNKVNGDRISSLIKEDSNEDKGSSSNSHSNDENQLIDPKIQPITKNELFSQKLKIIVKHQRQKTMGKTSLFSKFAPIAVLNEKRYHEDFPQHSSRPKNQPDQVYGSLPVKEDLSSSQVKSSTTRNLVNIVSKGLKNVDKEKLWLLDSNRFDQCVKNMKGQSQQEQSREDCSDTVIFDKDSSTNGTPPYLASKKIKTDDIMQQEKVQNSTSRMDHMKSHQGSINIEKFSQKNVCKLRQPHKTSPFKQELLTKNELLGTQEDISKLWGNDHSQVLDLMLQECQQNSVLNQNFLSDEVYTRLNVDKSEKLILFPKYKLPELDSFIQPTYYDIIYNQPNTEPQLELFDFNY